MKIKDNQLMTAQDLRKFGIVTGILIIVLIGGLVPWIWDKNIIEWQKITAPLGSLLIVWGGLHPTSLILVYKPWMAFAEKIGWVNTRIILLLLFYVMFVPIGFIMKIIGHDPMARKLNTSQASYRINKEPQTKDHMETPY